MLFRLLCEFYSDLT